MVYIVTGPTHCGKSTYIKKASHDTDEVIDILEYQQSYIQMNNGTTNANNILSDLYEFYFNVEKAIRNNDFTNVNLWIEVCFNNSHRIGQLVHTILAADCNINIKIIYLFHNEEFYKKNLNEFISCYAIEQQKIYDIYHSDNKNIEVIKLNDFEIEV